MNHDIDLLFDTGCIQSVIPQDFVEKHKIPYDKCQGFGFVANNIKISIIGITHPIPFYYFDTCTTMKFIILPRHNILVGMDWFISNKASITPYTRSIEFNERLIPAKTIEIGISNRRNENFQEFNTLGLRLT